MYEAGAVWSEKLMDDGKMNTSFVLQYLPEFLKGLNDIDEIYRGSRFEGKRYAHHGYAMSVLLEYMAKQMSQTSTLELYEIWRDTKGKTFDNLKAWGNKHSFKLFEGENYDHFILSLIKGEVIPIKPKAIVNSGDQDGDPAKFKTVRKGDETSDLVYPYGARIQQLKVAFPPDSLRNKQFSIIQRGKDVKTYVYIQAGNETKMIDGTSTDGSEIIIDGNEMETMRVKSGGADRTVYVFAITTNKTNSGTHESTILPELRWADSQILAVIVNGNLVCTSPTYQNGDEVNINPYAAVEAIPNAIKVSYEGKKMHVVCHKVHKDEENNQYVVESGTKLSFDIDDARAIESDKAKMSNLYVDGVFTFKSGDDIKFEEFYKFTLESDLPMTTDNVGGGNTASLAQLFGASSYKVWYINQPGGLKFKTYDITRKDWIYKWDREARKNVLERIDESTFTLTNNPSNEIKVIILFK